MPAYAARNQEVVDFARSLRNFAKALGGFPQHRGERHNLRETDPVAEAFAAARWAPNALEARLIAYKHLVRRFVSTANAPSRRSGVPAGYPASQSAIAVATRPQFHAQAEQTLDALRRLAPVERAALVLVAVERFSYADAAKVLEMEEFDFVEALARARQAFAARLAAGKVPSEARSGHLRLVT